MISWSLRSVTFAHSVALYMLKSLKNGDQTSQNTSHEHTKAVYFNTYPLQWSNSTTLSAIPLTLLTTLQFKNINTLIRHNSINLLLLRSVLGPRRLQIKLFTTPLLSNHYLRSKSFPRRYQLIHPIPYPTLTLCLVKTPCNQVWTTSVRSRFGPVQCVGLTFF